MYQDYNLSPTKQKAQNQQNMDNFYNGHKLPNSGRLFEQQALSEALRAQILSKTKNKDLYIQEEILENQKIQQINEYEKQAEIQKKIHQRDELRSEIQKVLEQKRLAKLRELQKEVENFL